MESLEDALGIHLQGCSLIDRTRVTAGDVTLFSRNLARVLRCDGVIGDEETIKRERQRRKEAEQRAAKAEQELSTAREDARREYAEELLRFTDFLEEEVSRDKEK